MSTKEKGKKQENQDRMSCNEDSHNWLVKKNAKFCTKCFRIEAVKEKPVRIFK